MTNIRPLPIELFEVARDTLNENAAEIDEHITTLREWAEAQPHLKARIDDQFLVAYLRFCQYDVERAKVRLDYYYTYKSVTAADLLRCRQIDEKLLGIARSGIFATLPNPVGPGGPRIHYTRMSNIDCSKWSVKEIFRFHMFRSEIEINTDDNWVISGVLEIIDFSKISFALLRQFEPSLFKRMAAFLEYALPTNLKGTHIINASREAQLILTLVRQVMKQKELLSIHSNVDSLAKAIGREYLPIDLGGENGTLEGAVADFETKLKSYEQYFIDDDEFGVTETLRKVDPAQQPQQRGTESIFRKFTFD